MKQRSVGWKLQREIILIFAWGPAILLQIAHPLIARGIAEHSTFTTEHRGRLRRFHKTLDAMLRIAFGTEQEASAAFAGINAIHDRVSGRLPEAAGAFPAGTPYSAHDPALLAWVHTTLIDMNLRVYELFVGSLSTEEKDRYCAEASAIEGPLGIPVGRLPRSFTQLTRHLDEMLASREIAVTDTARMLARSVIDPPAPFVAKPGIAFMRLVTLGLLPAAIREAYGLPWSARKETALRRSGTFSRRLLALTPSLLRHWPSAREDH